MAKDKPITEMEGVCYCCLNWKVIRMYILQDGKAAWVCEDCREGKKNGG